MKNFHLDNLPENIVNFGFGPSLTGTCMGFRAIVIRKQETKSKLTFILIPNSNILSIMDLDPTIQGSIRMGFEVILIEELEQGDQISFILIHYRKILVNYGFGPS